MSFTVFDHVLVLVLAAWMPIQGAVFYRRLERAIASGDGGARMRAYRRTLIWEWSLVAALIIGWAWAGRSLSELGLGFDTGWGLVAGLGLTAAACAFLVRQMTFVHEDEDAQEQIRETMSHLRGMVPANRREMKRFVALSITAGTCEELLYRGFLLWYLDQITYLWIAVVASSFIFGAGHVYQGSKGMLRTGIFGLVAACLFVLTGSLWASMILHAVLDLTSGSILRRALHPPDAPIVEDG